MPADARPRWRPGPCPSSRIVPLIDLLERDHVGVERRRRPRRAARGRPGRLRPTVPWWMLKLTTRTGRASHGPASSRRTTVPGHRVGAADSGHGRCPVPHRRARRTHAGTATPPPARRPATRGSVVIYGAELPTEADLQLLGTVEGTRILDLGCGTGRNAVALAQQGAKVLAVDPSRRPARRSPASAATPPTSASSCTRPSWPSWPSCAPTASTPP